MVVRILEKALYGLLRNSPILGNGIVYFDREVYVSETSK